MRIPSLYQSGRSRCTAAAAVRARWTAHARCGLWCTAPRALSASPGSCGSHLTGPMLIYYESLFLQRCHCFRSAEETPSSMQVWTPGGNSRVAQGMGRNSCLASQGKFASSKYLLRKYWSARMRTAGARPACFTGFRHSMRYQ